MKGHPLLNARTYLENQHLLLEVTEPVSEHHVRALTRVGVTVFVLRSINAEALTVYYPEGFNAAPEEHLLTNEEFVAGKRKEWQAWAKKQ